MKKSIQVRFRPYAQAHLPWVFHSVEVKKEIEILGEKFALHRRVVQEYAGVGRVAPVISDKYWDVTHIRTGLSAIVDPCKTGSAAVKTAETRISGMPPDVFAKAIAAAYAKWGECNQDFFK